MYKISMAIFALAVTCSANSITKTGVCDSGVGGSGFGTSTVTLGASATYNTATFSVHSYSCTLDIVLDLFAVMPQPGFLELTLSGGGDGTSMPGGAALYVDGVTKGSCFFSCTPSLSTVPITSGVPFEIHIQVTAFDFYNGQNYMQGSNRLNASIRAYYVGADDSPFRGLKFYVPLNLVDTSVPEPVGLGLFSIAVCLAASCRSLRVSLRSR